MRKENQTETEETRVKPEEKGAESNTEENQRPTLSTHYDYVGIAG